MLTVRQHADAWALRGFLSCSGDCVDCARHLFVVWVARDAKGARTGQLRHMDGVGDFHGFAGADIYLLARPKGNFDSLSPLRKQADASERKVSTLRQRLRRPEVYLAVLAALFPLMGVMRSANREDNGAPADTWRRFIFISGT